MKILTGSIHEHLRFRMADKGDTPAFEVKIPPTNPAMREAALPQKITIQAGDKQVEIDPPLPGEKEANFDLLGEEQGDDPQKEEKPAGEAPDAKEEGSETKEEPAKGEEKPKGKKDEPLGEVETAEEIAAKEALKTPPEAKKEETKAETPKIPEDDSDLDAMQLKPGTSPKVANDFKAAKEQTKIARAAARELAAKVAAVEAAKAEAEAKLTQIKPMDEKVEAELKELRTFRQHKLLEEDPEIVKEFTEKSTAADNRVFGLLEKYGMDAEALKKVKEDGLDALNDQWWKTQVLEKLADYPIAQQQIVQAILARQGVKEERSARIASISKDAETLTKQKEEQFKKHWEDFGTKIRDKSMTLRKDEKWANPIEIKPEMTAEAKAAAEAHNKKIEEGSQKFLAKVQAAISHDPEAIAEMAYASLHREVLLNELKTTKETLTAEIKSKDERIAELEADIAAISRTGRVGDRGSAPAKGTKVTPEKPKLGMTAEEAFENDPAFKD